ncbi:MAG: hypothetical protein WAX04_07490 [Oscillospiraceae bacterium]
MTYIDRIKPFLERQLIEYTSKSQKLKRKRKLVKCVFIISILVSISCSTVCATIATFLIPPIAISLLSTAGALATAISLQFNLRGVKEDLNKNIEIIDKIKSKIDYIVSCNGNFTEADYEKILNELAVLAK